MSRDTEILDMRNCITPKKNLSFEVSPIFKHNRLTLLNTSYTVHVRLQNISSLRHPSFWWKKKQKTTTCLHSERKATKARVVGLFLRLTSDSRVANWGCHRIINSEMSLESSSVTVDLPSSSDPHRLLLLLLLLLLACRLTSSII